MNKYNFYRIEHESIQLTQNEHGFKIGPYSYVNYHFDKEKRNESKLHSFLKKNESINSWDEHWAKVIDNNLGKIPPASYKLTRPGIFEDPGLREFYIKKYKLSEDKKHVKFDFCSVFGTREISSLYKWFNLNEDDSAATILKENGFRIKRYKVDNVVDGLKQSITIANGKEQLIETINF